MSPAFKVKVNIMTQSYHSVNVCKKPDGRKDLHIQREDHYKEEYIMTVWHRVGERSVIVPQQAADVIADWLACDERGDCFMRVVHDSSFVGVRVLGGQPKPEPLFITVNLSPSVRSPTGLISAAFNIKSEEGWQLIL